MMFCQQTSQNITTRTFFFKSSVFGIFWGELGFLEIFQEINFIVPNVFVPPGASFCGGVIVWGGSIEGGLLAAEAVFCVWAGGC